MTKKEIHSLSLEDVTKNLKVISEYESMMNQTPLIREDMKIESKCFEGFMHGTNLTDFYFLIREHGAAAFADLDSAKRYEKEMKESGRPAICSIKVYRTESASEIYSMIINHK